MNRRLLVVALTLALAACGDKEQAAQAPAAAPAPAAQPAKPDATATAQQLDALYSEFWDAQLELNPVQATFVGDPRYNDQLPNFLSAEYRQRTHDFNQAWFDKVSAIDGTVLDGQARLLIFDDELVDGHASALGRATRERVLASLRCSAPP